MGYVRNGRVAVVAVVIALTAAGGALPASRPVTV